MSRVSVESAAVGLTFRPILARFDPPRASYCIAILLCVGRPVGCWARRFYTVIYTSGLSVFCGLWASRAASYPASYPTVYIHRWVGR